METFRFEASGQASGPPLQKERKILRANETERKRRRRKRGREQWKSSQDSQEKEKAKEKEKVAEKAIDES